MKKSFKKLGIWSSLGGCILLQACPAVDPDILLRAELSFGTDLVIFLLENLARST